MEQPTNTPRLKAVVPAAVELFPDNVDFYVIFWRREFQIKTNPTTTALPPEFLDQILNTSLVGIYVYNLTTGINEYINAEYTRVTGWKNDDLNALDSEVFAELFHQDDRARVFAHMDKIANASPGDSFDIEYRFKAVNDQWVWCLSRDAPLDFGPDGRARRFVGTFMDITQRKEAQLSHIRMEAQLSKLQGWEAIGVLAGGVAHDFNNLLTPVLMNASMLRDIPGADEEQKELAQDIVTAAKRGADLCKELMLSVSSESDGGGVPIDLHTELNEALSLCRAAIPKTAWLHPQLSDASFTVMASKAEVHRILLNLVLNASEALEGRAGAITVSTRRCKHEQHDKNWVFPTVPGPLALIEVTDTGTGIPHGILNRVFDPFFTTRFAGRGLGLPAVMSAVRHMGGNLAVQSTEGVGTSVYLSFPLVVRDVPVRTPVPLAEDIDLAGRVLLVVEDEPQVAQVVARTLRSAGAQVHVARDGREGVELARRYADSLSLMVVDNMMPEMSGLDCLRILRDEGITTPAVVMSGYMGAQGERLQITELMDAILHKPFLPAELISIVARVMRYVDMRARSADQNTPIPTDF
jgi:two-component system cell cycle sensor histidine kinase/response regulator CckA